MVEIKGPSKKGGAKKGDATSADGSTYAGPVDLSLRASRLNATDLKEAVKLDPHPHVGSTAKVRNHDREVCALYQHSFVPDGYMREVAKK